jgi:hypothetical protein
MSVGELEEAHRSLWSRVLAPSRMARRVLRGLFRLDAYALALSTLMNGYYGLKRLRGTGPLTPDMPSSWLIGNRRYGTVAHFTLVLVSYVIGIDSSVSTADVTPGESRGPGSAESHPEPLPWIIHLASAVAW